MKHKLSICRISETDQQGRRCFSGPRIIGAETDLGPSPQRTIPQSVEGTLLELTTEELLPLLGENVGFGFEGTRASSATTAPGSRGVPDNVALLIVTKHDDPGGGGLQRLACPYRRLLRAPQVHSKTSGGKERDAQLTLWSDFQCRVWFTHFVSEENDWTWSIDGHHTARLTLCVV